MRTPLTPLVWLRQCRGGITSVAYHLRAPWDAVADEFPERAAGRQRHLVRVLQTELHDAGVVWPQRSRVVELQPGTVHQTCHVASQLAH